MIKVTLTNEILRYITEIEQNRYKVSSVKLSSTVMNRLRKNSKKKSSYASNKIEGNPLSEKQVDEVIKSGFLIANIDSAFRVWREKPWASHVGFDDFCEYILPYTVGQYQPLEDWRKKFATGYEEQIDLRHPRLSHSAFWAATWVNREIGTQILINFQVMLHNLMLQKDLELYRLYYEFLEHTSPDNSF